MNRVLIICAHPDDDILGCGGIMSKYSNARVVFRVIFIAEGSSCRFDQSDFGKKIVNDTINERNAFGVKALKRLGVEEYFFYNLPCGRLDTIPLIEINKIIENEIKSFKPDTIFTHSENDTNNDHCIVFKSTLISARPISEVVVSSIYSFEVLSSSEWRFTKSFEPNYFEILSEIDVINKWEALADYETEIKSFPFPRSLEGVKTLAKFRGLQSGVAYAEAFKLIRKMK